MTLILSHEHMGAMGAHARDEAPAECCGILAGTVEAQRCIVREVHPAANVREGDRTGRFLLDPRAHLRVQRECRERGLAIMGFYHSHPAGSATPSGLDVELAWAGVSYVIVSLRDGQVHELRSWRFDGQTRAFLEESVEIGPAGVESRSR